MQFSLPDMVRRTTNRRKRYVLAAIKPTAVLENDLGRIYIEVVRFWAGWSRDNLLPAYTTALDRAATALRYDDVSGIEGENAYADSYATRLLLALTPKLRRWTVRVEQYQRDRWVASVQPTNVDLATIIGPADVQVTLDAVLQANVALIRNVSEEARGRIAGIVFRGFQNRTPRNRIGKEISDALAMSRGRANRIAADQSLKLTAALSRERRRQSGLTDFIWRSSHKLNYRPEHQARDGKQYSEATAPADRAGELPFCGCVEQATFTI